MEQPEPKPQPRPKRFTKVVVGTVLAAGLALGIGAIAGAQTDPTTPPATDPQAGVQPAGPGQNPGPKAGRPGPGPQKRPGPGIGMGIHGEFVVPAPGGGYQTLASQNGKVTAVSATSIAVKSEDGFSRTYVVDDGTVVHAGDQGIADVKVGDDVHVMAVVTGNTAKAVDIGDHTAMGERHKQWTPERQKPQKPGSTTTTTI